MESEFGFHIIQLIDKRGDRIKVRHILRKPKVDQEVVEKTRLRLDSIADEIREGKYSFEEAASYISDDKDTRNNNGLMATSQTEEGRTSRFQMKALPTASSSGSTGAAHRGGTAGGKHAGGRCVKSL